MAKVVFGSLRTAGSARSATRAVGKKRIETANGGWATVRTLDANSAGFEDGLTYVFTRNVAKARRENKRILGSADIVPRKP